MKQIIILPAPHCRRSKKIMDFLEKENIPHKRIDLLSPQGQELSTKYHFMASPGILIGTRSINPYALLQLNVCNVDRKKFLEILTPITPRRKK